MLFCKPRSAHDSYSTSLDKFSSKNTETASYDDRLKSTAPSFPLSTRLGNGKMPWTGVESSTLVATSDGEVRMRLNLQT